MQLLGNFWQEWSFCEIRRAHNAKKDCLIFHFKSRLLGNFVKQQDIALLDVNVSIVGNLLIRHGLDRQVCLRQVISVHRLVCL